MSQRSVGDPAVGWLYLLVGWALPSEPSRESLANEILSKAAPPLSAGLWPGTLRYVETMGEIWRHRRTWRSGSLRRLLESLSAQPGQWTLAVNWFNGLRVCELLLWWQSIWAAEIAANDWARLHTLISGFLAGDRSARNCDARVERLLTEFRLYWSWALPEVEFPRGRQGTAAEVGQCAQLADLLDRGAIRIPFLTMLASQWTGEHIQRASGLAADLLAQANSEIRRLLEAQNQSNWSNI